MTEQPLDNTKWLSIIKKGIEEKKGRKLNQGQWTDFIQEVVLWLLRGIKREEDDTIEAAHGLISCGIRRKSDLTGVSDLAAFREELKREGVNFVISSKLFEKYIPSRDSAASQTAKSVSASKLFTDTSKLFTDMATKVSTMEFPSLETPAERGKRKLDLMTYDDEDVSVVAKKFKFWRAVDMPRIVDSGIQEWGWYLGEDGSKLFLRQCTIDCINSIWDVVEKNRKKWKHALDNQGKNNKRPIAFIVTGPPGLGKSWSSNAFLWFLLKKRQNIWFHSASKHTLTTFEFKDGHTIPTVSDLPERHVINFLAPEGTWFLYDSVGGGMEDGSMIAFKQQGKDVPCIIFSSPKDSNYKSGITQMTGFPGGMIKHSFWMPAWQWDELEIVMDSLYQEAVEGNLFFVFGLLCLTMLNAAPPHRVHPDETHTKDQFREYILSLYQLWGGIPRRFNQYHDTFRNKGKDAALQKSLSDFTSELNNLRQSLFDTGAPIPSNNKILDNVSQNAESSNESKCVSPPSWLVYPCPLEPKDLDELFMYMCYKFCSRQAEVAFFEYVAKQDTDAVRKFCKEVFDLPGANGLAFERFAHFVLTRTEDNDFRWRRYNNESQFSKVTLPRCINIECDIDSDNFAALKAKIQECISTGQNAVIDPKSDQPDAIDMFVVCRISDSWKVLAMQDTIGETHSFHPVKILQYRTAAKEAFIDAGVQNPSDDFFLHVVVVPREDPKSQFRLQKATMPKMTAMVEVQKTVAQIQLQNEVDLKNWTVERAKEACKSEKVKNYRGLKGETAKAAGAQALLVKAAGTKVMDLTWVLDGFFQQR